MNIYLYIGYLYVIVCMTTRCACLYVCALTEQMWAIKKSFYFWSPIFLCFLLLLFLKLLLLWLSYSLLLLVNKMYIIVFSTWRVGQWSALNAFALNFSILFVICETCLVCGDVASCDLCIFCYKFSFVYGIVRRPY